ncbi:hypothetical protein ACFQZ4_46295 [Catellatospora coxensis]|nr:hypothetical protein [Catellatospora coxensis]
MPTTSAVLRRLEPVHVALAVLWVVGMTVAASARRSDGTAHVVALLVWAAAGLSLLYLATLSASVRVTPTHLQIINPFQQHLIPRQLAAGVEVGASPIPRLLVEGGQAIRLVVLDRNVPPSRNVQAPSRRQAQLIMRMIADVPLKEYTARSTPSAPIPPRTSTPTPTRCGGRWSPSPPSATEITTR